MLYYIFRLPFKRVVTTVFRNPGNAGLLSASGHMTPRSYNTSPLDAAAIVWESQRRDGAQNRKAVRACDLPQSRRVY